VILKNCRNGKLVVDPVAEERPSKNLDLVRDYYPRSAHRFGPPRLHEVVVCRHAWWIRADRG
jgi:hypothetical protein